MDFLRNADLNRGYLVLIIIRLLKYSLKKVVLPSVL